MPTHPFRFQVETPLGPLRLSACPGRTATVSSGADGGGGFALELDGRRFALSGRAVRARGGWALREVAILAESPRGRPTRTQVVPAILPALSRALDENLRRLVERDVVEVHRERAAEREEIERIRGEIERRTAKVRELRRAAARAESERSAREVGLRAELARLGPAA